MTAISDLPVIYPCCQHCPDLPRPNNLCDKGGHRTPCGATGCQADQEDDGE